MPEVYWDYSLYLVTDRSYIFGRSLLDCVEEAIQGGVSLVQLREKNASSLEFYRLAAELKELTQSYRIPLIINDRLDIALAVNADGLHLGQDDLPLTVARSLLGKEKVIGISVSKAEEAVIAEQQGADYIGAGAMFATGTKSDAKLVSLQELQKIKEAVAIPVVAIGGIKQDNAPALMRTGIDGIAVVSAILARKDIREAAAALKDTLRRPSS